jgi:glycosyltransferase involved in cell wall biosynthesis
VAQLVACGHDIVLDLVGMVEKSEPVLDELMELAEERGVGERVRYMGYKPAGPALLECYRQADIYVIASYAESFPRTIWEAMASSLPVVATAVGSIPAYAGEAAVLVPPKDAGALANGIETLLMNAGLRQELIQKGMQLARSNTLERRAAEMIGEIEGWLASPAKP